VDLAAAAHPDESKYLLLAARVYTADNDAPKAESTLRHVVAIDPLNTDAARALSDCLVAQHREAEAKTVLEQLAQRLPSSTAAQTSLALLRERIGDGAGARTLYERIVVQDPRAAIASQRLAAMYVNLNTNLDIALDLAKVALRELPGNPAASDLLGWIYAQKGLTLNALPLLEDAVRAAPDTAMYRYHLGAAHLKSGNRDKARAELMRAVAIDPNLQEARAALAQLGT
jgi:tetratricopeptide (TPR) repeat protein